MIPIGCFLIVGEIEWIFNILRFINQINIEMNLERTKPENWGIEVFE